MGKKRSSWRSCCRRACVSAQEEHATPPVDAGGATSTCPHRSCAPTAPSATSAPQPFSALTKAEITAIVNAAASALDVGTATIAHRRSVPGARSPSSASPAPIRPTMISPSASPHGGVFQQQPGAALLAHDSLHQPGALPARRHQCLGRRALRHRAVESRLRSERRLEPGQVRVARELRRMRRFDGDKPCNAFDGSGCGAGLSPARSCRTTRRIRRRSTTVPSMPAAFRSTGSSRRARSLNEGIVSNGRLLGAIGVSGSTAIRSSTNSQQSPAPSAADAPRHRTAAAYPLPEPQNVFIEGIRLPFIGPDQKLKFNADGLPIGLEQPGRNIARHDHRRLHVRSVRWRLRRRTATSSDRSPAAAG